MLKITEKQIDYVDDRSVIENNPKFINCHETKEIRVYKYLYSPTLGLYILNLPTFNRDALIEKFLEKKESNPEVGKYGHQSDTRIINSILDFDFLYYFKVVRSKDKMIHLDKLGLNIETIDKRIESYREMLNNKKFCKIIEKRIGVIGENQTVKDVLETILSEYDNGTLEYTIEKQKRTTYTGDVDPYYKNSRETYIQD